MANNCKIFTPTEYVNELLDVIGYKGRLYGKSILENSCGNGKILVEIVRRYIMSCYRMRLSKEEVKRGLEIDICGIELEHINAVQCKKNLDLVAEEFGIKNVAWDIIEGDYLRLQVNRKFQFVIGNPPYIVYRDIEEKDRVYLKNEFKSCKKGKFDYYYPFVEKSITDLEKKGKMAYIIPYSIYKNVFASDLREYIKPYVTKIYDYTYQNKFPGTVTSSTILLLEKRSSKQFFYIDVAARKKIKIDKALLGKKWKFTEAKTTRGKYRFGDYFQVNNTIATLYNKAFVLEEYDKSDKYFLLPDGDKIEIEIVKPAVSKKRGKKSHNMAIIFPYYYKDGKLCHYQEDEFRDKFPETTIHLMRYKKELKNRAADKNALWFEYGRSQAITKIHNEKLVMPSIISSKVNITLENEDVIPCAGFFVTRASEYTLLQAKKLLESQCFYDYLQQIGIFTTGKSKRLTVKDIAEFTFEDWE
ncbi:MAG: SAM-dependent methyltransferase [Lachnospiraceae bacterium]|nr:SAM-dependent methyltransferase [Lachnospiraceae bacterium]